jgi:hypothetical protein
LKQAWFAWGIGGGAFGRLRQLGGTVAPFGEALVFAQVAVVLLMVAAVEKALKERFQEHGGE